MKQCDRLGWGFVRVARRSRRKCHLEPTQRHSWALQVPEIPQDLEHALQIAVRKREIVVAEWLISQGAGWEEEDPEGAPLVHHVAAEALKWLAKREQFHESAGLLVMAAEKGHVHVVRWLLERDIPDTGSHLTALGGDASLGIHTAALNGHLEVAKLLRSVEYAVQDKNLRQPGDILDGQLGEWSTATPVGWETMADAAGHGYLDLVKWLWADYRDGLDVDIFGDGENSQAMDLAASNGHLDVLQYLHALQILIASSARKRKRDGVKFPFMSTVLGGSTDRF
ncbi:hypothetical protein PHYPSEUDO_006270 [Phytophthora pseudosyringae]|uniref:Uncharacterized protein n=1 Tax=Phytophthora pseudosyringae TaxID=221518 RepID=A0A8T1VJX4_9STRA|nr:hypothetical protein PHYPSEUDO_006270 [Phytophthora pseudosyringae]